MNDSSMGNSKNVIDYSYIHNILIKVRKDKKLFVKKEKYEQFFTDISTADFMAKMFKPINNKKINILDPGCGIGILTVMLVFNICNWSEVPKEINAVLYEIDEDLIKYLEKMLEYCKNICEGVGIKFKYKVIIGDFLKKDLENIEEKVNFVIINPPYKKIKNNTEEKDILLKKGMDVLNYYEAFILVAKKYLKRKGQIVAITPRSFCNGVYSFNFRKELFSDMKIQHIHSFKSRNSVFRNDEVLQENIIYNVVKSKTTKDNKILISHSLDNSFLDLKINKVSTDDIIYPNDKKYIIRILTSKEEKQICDKMNKLPCKLKDLNIEVSTGPVVDFRIKKDLLSKEYVVNSIPIIFTEHFKKGRIKWPLKNVKKYNYIVPDTSNLNYLRLNGNYVLVKRVTSKEEKKRIVASLYEKEKINTNYVAYDNKINYYHINKKGLDLEIAKGLCIYLNSSIVDWYFRTMSGNTQVNVTDLRNIKYPSEKKLRIISKYFNNNIPNQNQIDDIIEKVLFN